MGLSFIFSVIAFIQYKTRKRWYEEREEEYMDRTSSVMDFNIINKPPNSPRLVSHNLSNSPARQHIHSHNVNYSMDETTIENFLNVIGKKVQEEKHTTKTESTTAKSTTTTTTTTTPLNHPPQNLTRNEIEEEMNEILITTIDLDIIDNKIKSLTRDIVENFDEIDNSIGEALETSKNEVFYKNMIRSDDNLYRDKIENQEQENADNNNNNKNNNNKNNNNNNIDNNTNNDNNNQKESQDEKVVIKIEQA